MDFESFAKLWPHQLDLLSGPLLEGDDDDVDGDDMDNPINSELITVQNTHNFSESSTNSECHDSLEAGELKDEVCESLASSKSAVHTFCVSTKNPCTSLKKTGLGMVVYVGRKHSCPDSDEEVDIETVDEELKRSPTGKAALSYRAFSRQMLSVAEDKEILHEVPNVIFACDVEKETGLSSISSENYRNSEINCSAVAHSLSVLQDKEILHEVPNVVSSNDTESITLGCKNLCESTTNTGTKCNAAVLQATDVDSLLEQFEASEGITSQELTKTPPFSPLPEENALPVDDKAMHDNPSGKKGISSYIIQKIRMSSSVKKGPILIPPSHQPKSKTRSSCSQSGFETRKSCRSSSSPFPLNKECASKNAISSKYSFTLEHDHDYCTSSCSNVLCEKDEEMKSLENFEGYEKDTNLETGCFPSDKYLSCESDDFVESHCVRKNSEEDDFIPDAEIEVEVADSHVDIDESRPVKTPLAIPNLHCTANACEDTSKASCSMKSDKYISGNIHRISDKTGPVVPSVKLLKSASPKKSLQAKCCVNNFDKVDETGSVLLNDKLTEPHLRNTVNNSSISNCNSLTGKHKQESISADALSVSSAKKHCSWLTSDIQNTSQRTLCVEKIEDALWRRTRSPCVDNNGRPFWKSEKQKQIEERRVVYVGKLPEGLKVNDLRECFVRFGPIQDISIHFRENGDNYGFVTFFNRSDAYEVVERGKLDPKLRRFDLCFGGRRQFCRTRYSDLDSVDEGPFRRSLGETDFDTLLQKAKAGF